MILLSIDPASHGVGCALWLNGKLVAAEYVPNPSTIEGSGPRKCVQAAQAAIEWVERDEYISTLDILVPSDSVTRLVFEYPQVYSRGANKTRGNPNTCVLPLVAVDAALAALMPDAEVQAVQPHEWKAGTSKPEQKDIGKVEYVITTRVKARLSSEELAVVRWPNDKSEPTKEDHKRSYDVADGIGVGLFVLGRFERHRVFARD